MFLRALANQCHALPGGELISLDRVVERKLYQGLGRQIVSLQAMICQYTGDVDVVILRPQQGVAHRLRSEVARTGLSCHFISRAQAGAGVVCHRLDEHPFEGSLSGDPAISTAVKRDTTREAQVCRASSAVMQGAKRGGNAVRFRATQGYARRRTPQLAASSGYARRRLLRLRCPGRGSGGRALCHHWRSGTGCGRIPGTHWSWPSYGAGRGRPRWSRRVCPAYSVRYRPRRCKMGMTWSVNAVSS